MIYETKLRRGMRLEVFVDLFNVFNTQRAAALDETYTFDRANPIVGGDTSDLIFAKANDAAGGETSDPVGRNPNFANPSGLYAPFYTRLGARIRF